MRSKCVLVRKCEVKRKAKAADDIVIKWYADRDYIVIEVREI